MEDKFTKIEDSLWKNKDLTLLGVNIFALIQRREQGSQKACTESATNMAEHFHVSLNTLKREVKELAQGGYILKQVIRGIGWKLNTLPPQGEPSQGRPTEGWESTHTGLGVKPQRVGGEPSQGHKTNKKETKKQTKKQTRGNKAPTFLPFSSLPDGEVKEALLDYVEVRKGGKSPIKTARQERLLLNKLEELAPNDKAKQVEIINAAIVSGWLNFYPLKEDAHKQKTAFLQVEEHTEQIKEALGRLGHD